MLTHAIYHHRNAILSLRNALRPDMANGRAVPIDSFHISIHPVPRCSPGIDSLSHPPDYKLRG
jgi:hypothetical protein